MNVVHYMIGLPPKRRGGAAIYALSLLQEQMKFRDTKVSILIPGDSMCLGNKSKIKKCKSYLGVALYEISNPVLEPLMNGIKKASYIIGQFRKFDRNNLEKYYDEVKPDIIHIHTLMGIPKELLSFLKSKGVKIILTSHDYYGICPRVNLIDRFGRNCKDASGKFCEDCNVYARSRLGLVIQNSNFFINVKGHIPQQLKKKFNPTLYKTSGNKVNLKPSDNDSFIKLHDYYQEIFKMVSAIHFNSFVAKQYFSRYLELPFNKVIPITNKFIHDNRKYKHIHNRVRIVFIGGLSPSKGFNVLRDALLRLNGQGIINWTLSQWGEYKGEDKECSRIKYCGKYSPDQLKSIYDNTDLLVVPSLWGETFSFVALEALSYGVPVLMSDNVGAQLLLQSIAPSFVYHSNIELHNKLKWILEDPNCLSEYNNNIVLDSNINFSEKEHAKQIINFYHQVLSL